MTIQDNTTISYKTRRNPMTSRDKKKKNMKRRVKMRGDETGRDERRPTICTCALVCTFTTADWSDNVSIN